MKRVVIGIFAHPDDEAFNASGSLFKATQSGIDVHLLVATRGEAGKNPDSASDLGAIRLKEWHKSGALIGATSMHCFNYKDGSLCNNSYLEIAKKVLAQIKKISQKYTVPIELSLITLDQNGITGHIDHIVIANITTFIYEQIKAKPIKNVTLASLKYFCVCRDFAPTPSTDWIFMPEGHKESDFDEIIDVTDVYEQKLKIMQAHKSQREDMKDILARYGNKKCGKQECFIYYKSE